MTDYLPGGEAAYQALLDETAAFNAERRYRLTSMPDVVVDLTSVAEASQVVGNLLAKQDRVATDISFIMPHVIPITPELPPYMD